ncbi:MAG: hypothetical protein PVF43_12950 [Candidatus Eiseniibacteriota bacterium]|jgi:hypothetical protein
MATGQGQKRTLWQRWRAVAGKIGHVNGLALLTILYWLVISLVALGFALFRQDPLERRRRGVSSLVDKHLRTEPGDYEHIY